MKTFAAAYAAGAMAVLALIFPNPAWSEERAGTPIMPENIEDLPRKAEPSDSLFSYFKDRTQIAYGFEENYRDNLLSQDNNKVEEFISTLEGEIFFSDPRGSVLYGLDYEVNFRRYYFKRVQAADQDFHAFLDIDPGGRYKYGVRYDFTVDNSFTFGVNKPGVDTIQRSTQLIRDHSHNFGASYRYALNDTNSLIPSATYSIDQTVRPVTLKFADRTVFTAALDIDHDLNPNWIISGGYGFEDLRIPTDSRKDAQSHGIHAGLQYELSEITSLETEFSIIRREFKTGKISTGPASSLQGTHLLNPRTFLAFNYTNSNIPSYSAASLEFQNSSFSGSTTYELTPLVKVTLGGTYDRKTPKKNSSLPGGATPQSTKASNQFSLKTTVEWDVRDSLHVSLFYTYFRAKESDLTSNNVVLQIEKAF